MALIVEDGTGTLAADSYVSLADARTISTNYGIPLPDDDTAAEVALRQGFLMINSNESQLQGYRTTSTQTGAFPRTGVVSNCYLLDDDAIPNDLIFAQIYGASAIDNGLDINQTFNGLTLKSFTVPDVYSETYQDGIVEKTNSIVQGLYNSLYPLTIAGFENSPCGGGGGLTRNGDGWPNPWC